MSWAQTNHFLTKFSRKPEEFNDDDETQPQRKRPKPSVSDESVNLKKNVKHYRKTQMRSKNQHLERYIGINREERKTLGKRKRVEKTQRGISRSKKIRRT